GIIQVLNLRGFLALYRRDAGAALQIFEESLSLMSGLPDSLPKAFAYLGRGYASCDLADYDGARHWFSQNLAIAAEVRHVWSIIASLWAHSLLAEATGEPERSLRLAGAATALSDRVGLAPVT